MEIVTLNEEEANHLLKTARIKIDWVNALYVLAMGNKLEHGGPERERKGFCLKCGSREDTAKDCTKNSCCILCTDLQQTIEDVNHISGSSKCPVF